MKNKLISFSEIEYNLILEQSKKEERTFTATVRKIVDDFFKNKEDKKNDM